jgi:uncharacterized protein VirK/YbjX
MRHSSCNNSHFVVARRLREFTLAIADDVSFLERPRSAPLFVLEQLHLKRNKSLRPGSILDVGICSFNALRSLRATAFWLSFLDDLERQHGLPPALPETVAKPLRNFAVYRLSLQQRVDLLCTHYLITSKTLPACIFSSLWSGSKVLVGDLSGRKGGRYALMLEPSGHCGREGEYSFVLVAEDGFELATLTFTLTFGSGEGSERALLIGGLQGPSSFFGPGAKERIVATTRDLSGLRPKMALFVAASAFAQISGATALLAVSNRKHTINADARYQRRKLHADYDAFWIERGGKPTDCGFRMPLGIEPRGNRSGRNEQCEHVVTLVRDLFQMKMGSKA